MKVINGSLCISSIYKKYIMYIKTPTNEEYRKLYNMLTRQEIDLIITQDYPKKNSHRMMLRKLRRPIEEMEIDHVLLQ